MQNLPSETGADISPDDITDFAATAQDKACSLVKSGTDYVKENPIPVVLGAFVIGAVLGSLVVRREREVEVDKLRTAVNWLEDTYSQLADKIPQTKKRFFSETAPGLLEQAQDVGKKLKWW